MKITACRWCTDKFITNYDWLEFTGDLLPDIAPHLASVATWATCVTDRGTYIINLETGLSAGGAHRYQKHAIAHAANLLSTKTVDDIIERMSKAPKKCRT